MYSKNYRHQQKPNRAVDLNDFSIFNAFADQICGILHFWHKSPKKNDTESSKGYSFRVRFLLSLAFISQSFELVFN